MAANNNNANRQITSSLGTGGMLGQPSKTFTTFSTDLMREILTNENPELGPKLVREGENILFKTFQDWAIEHPIITTQATKGYFSSYGESANFMTRYFTYERTDQQTYFKHKIITNRQMPNAVQVRKTEARLISSTIEQIEGHATYTHTGFTFDYYAGQKDIGLADINLKFAQCGADITAFITWTAVNALLETPQHAREPNQLYPNRSGIALRVSEVFADEQQMIGRWNKDANGVWASIRDANTVFSQYGPGYYVTDVLLSRSDMFYITKMNDVVARVDKSGPNALVMRQMIASPRVLNGIYFNNIPFIETTVQNRTDQPALMTRFSTGSQIVFEDRTGPLRADEYRSWMRDVEYCSLRTNTWDRYTYIDFLRNCPSFIRMDEKVHFDADAPVPGDDLDAFSRRYGMVNENLLEKFIIDSRGKDRRNDTDAYSRLGTNPNNNLEMLDTLVRPVDTSYFEPKYNTDRKCAPEFEGRDWFPVMFIGELTEQNCAYRHFASFYESFAHSLYSGLTSKERNTWSAICGRSYETLFDTSTSKHDDLFDSDATDSTVTNKIRTRMYEILSQAHPCFLNSTGDILASFIESIQEIYTQDQFTSRGIQSTKFAFVDSPASHKTKLTAQIETSFKSPNNNTPTQKHIFRYPLFVPSPLKEENGISPFVYKFLRAFDYSPELTFAAHLFLSIPLCIDSLDRMYTNNIRIPLGGRNIRMRERQWMYSAVALAMGPGKLGTFFHSGFDSFLSFNSSDKQFVFQIGEGHGFLVDANKQFVHMPYVRGGAIIGGSDNLYFDQHTLLTGNRRVEADYACMMMERNGSNIAVLGSYNEAVAYNHGGEPGDRTTYEKSISVLGYWDVRHFRTRLHSSPDFTNLREKIMYSGQFLFNYLHSYLGAMVEASVKYNGMDIDPSKMSAPDLARLRDNNLHAHQPTTRIYDGYVRDIVKTSSKHPWGVIEPGIADKVSSNLPVTDNAAPSVIEQQRKKLRYTAF
jgi:hypothetical protein